jgi:hypothetical protein
MNWPIRYHRALTLERLGQRHAAWVAGMHARRLFMLINGEDSEEPRDLAELIARCQTGEEWPG